LCWGRQEKVTEGNLREIMANDEGEPSPSSSPRFLSRLDGMTIDEARPWKRARTGEIAFTLPPLPQMNVSDSDSEVKDLCAKGQSKKKKHHEEEEKEEAPINDPMDSHTTESGFMPYTPGSSFGTPDLSVPSRKRPRAPTPPLVRPS
jgi:hypothetical protein